MYSLNHETKRRNAKRSPARSLLDLVVSVKLGNVPRPLKKRAKLRPCDHRNGLNSGPAVALVYALRSSRDHLAIDSFGDKRPSLIAAGTPLGRRAPYLLGPMAFVRQLHHASIQDGN